MTPIPRYIIDPASGNNEPFRILSPATERDGIWTRRYIFETSEESEAIQLVNKLNQKLIKTTGQTIICGESIPAENYSLPTEAPVTDEVNGRKIIGDNWKERALKAEKDLEASKRNGIAASKMIRKALDEKDAAVQAERSRLRGLVEEAFKKLKQGLIQMQEEAPNMRSPDGRFGKDAENRNCGIEQGAKLALTMVELIEEREIAPLLSDTAHETKQP